MQSVHMCVQLYVVWIITVYISTYTFLCSQFFSTYLLNALCTYVHTYVRTIICMHSAYVNWPLKAERASSV